MDNNSNTFSYFFLSNFPSSSSSSTPPMKILREEQQQQQHPSPLRLAPAIGSKPKQRKIGKSSSNPNPTPRNPQRGLGVAQLERIRLQNPQIQPVIPSNFDFYPTGYPVANGYGYGSGPGTTMSSALQQYSLDRVRVSAGSPYLHELPSNQRTFAACVSDSCHLCCKKKRSFSETLALQECFRLNLAAAIEEEMKVRAERSETRVYQFFPETDGRDREATGDRTAAGASSSSAADDGADGFLDLSLKLAG